MAHEVELKFDVEADVDADALARSAGGLAGAAREEKAHETVYYDTKDGALRRAGFSLRVRRSGGRYVQTVKRKSGRSAGLFVRQEWETEVSRLGLHERALQATPLKSLLKTVKAEALAPLIRTEFRRTAWTIDHKGSRIEVVLDEGEVRSGRTKAPLRELELELKAGKPRLLFDLAREIGAKVPLRLGVLSKGERGYALAERRLDRCARAEPIALAPTLSEGEAFRAVAFDCLRHYRLNEMVLLERRDPEALHQARIALRRLRAALSLFRTTVRGKEYQVLRDGIGWLAGQFGDARDLDVVLAAEAENADEHLPRHRLLKARDKAYAKMETALRSDQARALMLRLALWIEMGAWRFRERSTRDVGALAAEQLERQWRKVRRHGSRIAKAKGQELHRLRLDVKKLRYSAEFLAGLHGKRSTRVRHDRFIVALRDLQDRLGDLNDAEATAAVVSRLAPGLRGSADRIRSLAEADEAVTEAREALDRAAAAAGYWADD